MNRNSPATEGDRTGPALPPTVAFVAPSGTGKTTLIEGVIASLTARGLRVGAVKHDAHRFAIDVPGKDSFRFTAAGAAATLVVDGEKLALVRRHDVGAEGGAVEELIARYLADVDLVVVEGYRASSLPRIVVRRAGTRDTRAEGPEEAARPEADLRDGRIIAVVSDGPVTTERPVLPLAEPERVADFLIARYLGEGYLGEGS